MGPQIEKRLATFRPLALLFLISLLVRAAFLVPVAASGVPPLYDEAGYYARAVAFARIGATLISGGSPARADLVAAYGNALWPPLHPLLLAVPLALVRTDVAVARAAVAVLSALTTALIYLLTARLSTRRAALWAAAAHIAYPGFIAFSHYLWSETTYTLFLVASVYLAVAVAGEGSPRRRVLLAALLGTVLGLCVLTRVAGTALLAFTPAWLLFRMRGTGRARIVVPAVVCAAALLSLLPWEAVLLENEGRPTLVVATAESKLLLGNNPWRTEDDLVSDAKAKVKSEIATYANEHGVTREAAGRALFLDYVRSQPIDFLRGIFAKFRALWTADGTVLRHVLGAAYPPFPAPLVGVVWIALVAGLLTLVGFGVPALFDAHHRLSERDLLLGCIAATIAPPLLTVSGTRMALPALALLCPAFGHAIAHIRDAEGARRRGAVFGAAVVLLAANVLTLSVGRRSSFLASSYYAPVLSRLPRPLSSRAFYSDLLQFRLREGASPDGVRLAIASEGYEFAEGGGDTLVWRPATDGATLAAGVVGRAANVPLRLTISRSRFEDRSAFEPVRDEAWMVWQPTGLEGIDFRWAGGARLGALSALAQAEGD